MNDLHTVFSEAVHFHQQGLLQDARNRYLKVLDVLPDNINVLGNMGILCRDLGDMEQAVSYCLRAVEAAPDDPTQHINLGAVYEPLGKTEEARCCYEKALSLMPTHPKALNNLGKLLHMLGESEKGMELIQRSVTIEPSSPAALNNLGVILSSKGDNRSAIAYIERSLELAPNTIETIYNLAGLYNCEGEYNRAAELLERLLERVPDHAPAGHMLAALKGTVTETAPSQYVTETFDKYASRFDNHIQNALGYTVPAVLAGMTAALTPGTTFSRCLDLGCGTGLSGSAFQDLADNLTGVDLSSQMLLRAREKNIYHRLECSEISEFLENDSDSYDLFVAADVFIYLGRLEPFFSRLPKRAKPGALLVCSIERFTGDGDYTLCSSGRYAHTQQYLCRQAEAAGFAMLNHKEHGIRKENNSWIAGDLYIFRN